MTIRKVLINNSLLQVADTHLPPEYHYSVRAWILGLAVPIVPLGIIRTLRLLVPFSAVATAFILVGLGCTMSFVITGASLLTTGTTDAVASASHQHVGPSPLPDLDSRPFIAPIAHMPLFFATVLFAMEGIGTVSIPVANIFVGFARYSYPSNCYRSCQSKTLCVARKSSSEDTACSTAQ